VHGQQVIDNALGLDWIDRLGQHLQETAQQFQPYLPLQLVVVPPAVVVTQVLGCAFG
jgi:hypothetical protein